MHTLSFYPAKEGEKLSLLG